MPDLIDLTSDGEDDDILFINERAITQTPATNPTKRTFQNVYPVKFEWGPPSNQPNGNATRNIERPVKRQKTTIPNDNVVNARHVQAGESLAIRSSPAPKVKKDPEWDQFPYPNNDNGRRKSLQLHTDGEARQSPRLTSDHEFQSPVELREPKKSSQLHGASKPSFYDLLKSSIEPGTPREILDDPRASPASHSMRLPSPPLSPKNGRPLPPFVPSSASLHDHTTTTTAYEPNSSSTIEHRSGTFSAIPNLPAHVDGTNPGRAMQPKNAGSNRALSNIPSRSSNPLSLSLFPSSTTFAQRDGPQPASTLHEKDTSIKMPTRTPAPLPVFDHNGRPTASGKFQIEHEHLLIFLKEVKRFSWTEITRRFTTYYPSFKYHTLQSRYSTVINKRDRSRDPAQLQLPHEFASESLVDWKTVHANNPAPFVRPVTSATSARPGHSRWSSPDQDNSSGAENVRPKSTRARRVNYTLHKTLLSVEQEDSEMANSPNITAPRNRGADSLVDRPSRAASDLEATPLPNARVIIESVPIDMDFDFENATVTLHAHTKSRPSAKALPYLSRHDRSSAQAPPPDWDWAESSSHWQGTLLHVDFTPHEMEIVEQAILECTGQKASDHRPPHRRIYRLVKKMTEPTLLLLCRQLKSRLLCRDTQNVKSFLEDAHAGALSHFPKVHRLGNLQQKGKYHDTQLSVSEILRQREMGRRTTRDSRSRQGWRAASQQLTYTLKNRLTDSLGPVWSWTGASSDIHTVAWAPDGRSFAAGAVAVDDPDSMQYNRPNNLVYGCLSDGTIHELAEHFKVREKTESGANSTDAMLRSQDPLVYTTVSAVSYSASGNVLYSGGYDGSVCVWDVPESSSQPHQRLKINMKAQIDMLAVNPVDEDLVATAVRKSDNKAIRLIKVEGERIGPRCSFQSSKALERSHLKMLPTALQFSPHYGDFLLAGFGANSRENGLDTEGDICLWDVETQQQILGYGVSRNIFDIKFNPNRRNWHWFAAGCVAGSNANRGMRSVVKLYVEKDLDKTFTPQMELECRALDINDVVWSPYDERLIATGCTDGRVYLWDIRRPDNPMHILSHGPSLMPLPEGVSHEVTDTGVRFLSWGQNDTRLYSGSSDGIVKIWDVTRSNEDSLVKDLITLDSGIMSGAFTDDKSKLLLGEVNGSVHVLEVGRDDYTLKDAEKLRWVPYADEQTHHIDDDTPASLCLESGITEANSLIQTGQIQFAPLGSLPVRQAVQGPHYAGPFDRSHEAEILRETAFQFQSHMARIPGPQCSIQKCKDSVVKVTSEEVGDSGRSTDRIPDELRRLYKSIDSEGEVIIAGKVKCSRCRRLAQPQQSDELDAGKNILCERCSFACFRCGASIPIGQHTTSLICDSCGGTWDIGALGYDCTQQPFDIRGPALYPSSFAEHRRLDDQTTFGDEMNALSDHYFAMALDRPESPPLLWNLGQPAGYFQS